MDEEEITQARRNVLVQLSLPMLREALAGLLALNAKHPDYGGIEESIRLTEEEIASRPQTTPIVADFGPHAGYAGAFTRNEALGAYPNGTRIVKHGSEVGDGTPDGTPGSVLGSVFLENKGFFYFIEWDDKPKMAVGCSALKIGLPGAKMVVQ